MTSPPTPPVSSQPPRSRTSSDLSVRSPQLLHRPHTGRIERTRSTSSRLLSIRNQEAIWEAATGRNWAPVDQHPSPEQSLPEYITPLSLSVAGNRAPTSSPSVISTQEALRPLEEETSFGEPASTTPEPEVTDPNLSSMEFMMPPQYPHYGSHSSSYHSSYLDQYSGAEQERTYTSPQTSSYAPSYATSPAMVGSSATLSPRGGSVERESTSGHPYSSAVRSPYGTATSSTQPGYYGSASQAALQYGTSYSTSTDPYTSNPYGLGYGQPQQSYLPSQTPGYAQHYATGSSPYDSTAHGGSDDPQGVRVVNSRPKPQCWEHGCNGRQFSTFSNLLRHQREKSGASQKSECPRCGAVFTRTTARNGHMAHDKCKRKSTTSTSEAE